MSATATTLRGRAARGTMAQPYLTAEQLKRKKQKGDKYYPNACTRCGCGIRITKGRVNAPTCHGESGKARKACCYAV